MRVFQQLLILLLSMKYRVREGFFVHLAEDKIASPGTILELSSAEFSRFAHQLELVEVPSKESKRESKVQG